VSGDAISKARASQREDRVNAFRRNTRLRPCDAAGRFV